MKYSIITGVLIMLLAAGIYLIGKELHQLFPAEALPAKHQQHTSPPTNPMIGTRFCTKDRFCY